MNLRGPVAFLVRLVAGVRVAHALPPPQSRRIYFANHSSHMDFVVVWSVLPRRLRDRTRPVAAADYWGRGGPRTWLAREVFRAVLVAREGIGKANNPLDAMAEALEAGDDLILFPEGTRSRDGRLGPFRAGLFHLAKRAHPVELVPVHLENLHRILPKGELLPVPILGRVAFGHPVPPPGEGEPKAAFLERARAALIAAGGGLASMEPAA